MRRQSSSAGSIATQRGVRPRCALLLSLAALLAGCAYDERLSLGRHQPPVPADPAADGVVLEPQPPQAGAAAPASAPAEPVPSAQEPTAPQVPPVDAGSAPPGEAADLPQCAPAVYAAELWCQVDPRAVPRADPRVTTPMSTVVSFAVEPTSTPGWLAIQGGTLEFEFIGSQFSGRLAGGLDCSTREFHAQIVDGSYAALFANGPPLPGSFEGELHGRLSSTSPALSGSWWHGPSSAPPDAPSCVGTWTARPLRRQ